MIPRGLRSFWQSGLVWLTLLSLAPAASATLVRVEQPLGGEPGLTVAAEDPSGIEIHYGMEAFGIERLTVAGTPMQTVTLPGAVLPNNAGAPNLPGRGGFIALPQGASASFTLLSAETRLYREVTIAPALALPLDGVDTPPVYEMDQAIYGRDAYYPESPVTISAPRKMRGVDVVMIGITPFQYNPVTHDLLVYTELDVRIDFTGGTGVFGDPRLRSRYWEPLLRDHLLNYAALPPAPEGFARASSTGSEYLIITPDDPGFIAWADTLKNWRQLQGIDTQVVTLTEIGGTSADAIEDFLDWAYIAWSPAPAAFLILGDYVSDGSLGVTSPRYDNYCVSDNIYADVDGDDLPEMASGRICARNAQELETMIGKMLAYERQPVTDSTFYAHPVISGGWQSTRWFILCCEIIRGHQVNVLGKDPTREYAIYSGVPDSAWSTAADTAGTNAVLAHFGPEGLGYIPAQLPLLDWGGTAARINADLNAGAYMIMHRDHGTLTGWGEPRYLNTDLNALTTDQYPFVLSINCETGRYNASTESFAEKFHRQAHGALGIIAATENSFSFVNDTFAWGIFDGLWPDFDPDYGQAGEPNLRTAFAHASGKYYLEASGWPYNDYDKAVTYHLFHHHGDAFMTMYTEVPESLAVSHDELCFLGTASFGIQADSGAVIALTVAGEIVGVADATGSPQQIAIVPQTQPGQLQITVTLANHFRYADSVPIILDAPALALAGSLIRDYAAEDSLGNTDGNDDGGPDAGETIELVLSLQNTGTDPATGVTATISTSDPYAEILDAVEAFDDLAPDSVRTCLDDYEIAIDSACPDGHALVLDLLIEAAEGSWPLPCTLEVHAPVLTLSSFAIVDSLGGDDDGRCDAGETFQLVPQLTNTGGEMATDLTLELHVYHPAVTLTLSKALVDTLRCAEGLEAVSFWLSVDSAAVEPEIYVAELVVSADWGQNAICAFEIPVGGFFDDVEAGQGNWGSFVITPEYADQWHRSQERDHTPGGMWSWKFGDTGEGYYADLADGALVSEPIALNDQCQLRFWHWIEAEVNPVEPGYCFDGGMVEMSVDDGPWTEIIPEGGYPYLISNDDGLGPWDDETPVFSGQEGWQQAVYQIDGYSGQARFRFRFGSDGADGGSGWFVDEIEFTGRSYDPSASEETTPLVLHPAVRPNQPNPFNRATWITYELPASTSVRLQIFDPAGRLVRTLIDGVSGPGVHGISWNGRDQRGAPAGAGVYFCRFDAGTHSQTRKLVLAE